MIFNLKAPIITAAYDKFVISFLTLKAPIKTAAGDKFWDIFPNFQQK